MMRLRIVWAAGLLLSLHAAAATESQTESTPSEKLQVMAIVDGALGADQRLIRVRKGDRLRWRITSTTAGELHLHAYRLVQSVQPGQTQELVFKAFAAGKYRVEWHGANEKPTAAGAHHAPALATLEVRP